MKDYEVSKIRVDNGGKAVAITSMLLGRDGNLYVGLTGSGDVLVRIRTSDDKVESLGRIFPERPGMVHVYDKIHNSLVEGADGSLYIGQGLNIDWNAAPYDCDLSIYGGGHLFRMDPASGHIEDFGVQVPMNAIHGLAIDRERGFIYGYTIPDNHFFVHDLKDHNVRDFGTISYYASHNLVCSRGGTVYGGYYGNVSWSGGAVADESKKKFSHNGTYLFRYSPDAGRLERTTELIVYGDEYDIFSNKGIDGWLCASDGTIYGGTAVGGVVFTVDEKSGRAAMLGKPLAGPRVSGIKEGPGGVIYFTAGFPNMHLVTYDPATGRFTDHDSVNPDRELCYFHGIAVLPDGTVFVGETDSNVPEVYKLTPKRPH